MKNSVDWRQLTKKVKSLFHCNDCLLKVPSHTLDLSYKGTGPAWMNWKHCMLGFIWT